MAKIDENFRQLTLVPWFRFDEALRLLALSDVVDRLRVVWQFAAGFLTIANSNPETFRSVVIMRRLLMLMVLVLVPGYAAAELPAPGSTYHLLFASRDLFRTVASQSMPPSPLRFGSIAGADYQVSKAAFIAGLSGTVGWTGATSPYRALLSVSGDTVQSRLAIGGPVYNLNGEVLATSHADLYDGSINAAVGYNEYGELISENPQVWTGSASVGVWSGNSCGTWNTTSSASSGRIGNASSANASWMNSASNRTCNLSARLYGLSQPLVAPLWGDYDGSGMVDGGDFLEWQRQLGQTPTAAFRAARGFSVGLISETGQHSVVNADDLEVWREFYGQSLPAETAAVPEPSGGLLLAMAGLLLAKTLRPVSL